MAGLAAHKPHVTGAVLAETVTGLFAGHFCSRCSRYVAEVLARSVSLAVVGLENIFSQ